MRLVRNTAIRFAGVTVCLIAMILSVVFTLIANAVALVVAPIMIAAYAADFAWTGNEVRSLRWEMTTHQIQTVFTLPTTMTIALASCVNDNLRSKIR